jgi:hypothetical protein
VLVVPSIGPALGPALRRSLARATWSRLREIERELGAGDLDPLALFLEVRRELSRGSAEFGGEAEAPFVEEALPDDLRVEIGAEVEPRALGTALADAIRAVPLRWRPDVLDGVWFLLWELQDRRPRWERGDTVWRRYGRRRAHRRGKRH